MTPRSGGGLLFLEDGVLSVDDAGRVARLAPASELPEEELTAVVDLRPHLVVPGLVDTHVHFPQTRVVGSATGPLLDWLERSVFPEEARFRDAAYAREVAGEFTTSLASRGTTAASIFSSSSPRATAVLFEALARSGLRASAGLTLMDQNCPEALRLPAAEALPACRELAAAWHGHDGGRLRFVVTPRFAISCSRPLMEGAAALARELDLPVQTHVSENLREGEATLEVHPYGVDYVDVYDKVGLLGARTLLAHAIHFSPREWDVALARGVALSHCPDSNFFLGSGRMRAKEALSRGLRVGLGTDVAAGRTFSVRRVAASAYDAALCVGEPLSPPELFELATLGGARAMGLGDVAGSLEPGKDADFAVFRVPPHARTEPALLSALLFSNDDVLAEQTFVRGAPVWTRPAAS